MNYLEAKKWLAIPLEQAQSLPLLLGSSAMVDQLGLFLRAQAAKRSIRVDLDLLPFGTLMQSITLPPIPGRTELFLLFPWDLVPELDWRLGTGPTLADETRLRHEAARRMELLSRRPLARFAYLPAPVPPLLPDHSKNAALTAWLTELASRHQALILDPRYYALSSHLASGNPIAGRQLGPLSDQLITWLLEPPAGSIKVIVTDLDHTAWHGVVGEVGPDGVLAEPVGMGYRHFLFQSLLKRLKMQGLLLAAVSRNDEDLARAPFASGRMPLDSRDFVAIRAGYGAKSAQLHALANQLNLGLEAFVFIDDNPVELAEVTASLPMITTLPFPADEESMPHFLDQISRLASRRALTAEDAQRTEIYHRLLTTLPPPTSSDEQLRLFLQGLSMVLTLREPPMGQWTRAHQLINKTNQFNLNGMRWNEEDLAAILADGGRLFTATLEDRTGTHGEILACLVEVTGHIRAWVLSCRVLQRRVEYAFLLRLLTLWRGPPLVLDFVPTERNAPMRLLLEDPAMIHTRTGIVIDVAAFRDAHGEDASLFTLHESLREESTV
ncbi:MAG: HAD-IIIC family phosphatase [Magnetococcales bacterium]|nr:HAD-IIIC family phosphatase [Magnetococcales bacterium]